MIKDALIAACLSFTPEQAHTINTAQQLGDNVLAAVVWQESFLGGSVIRFNPKDGALGSYGVAHMQLTTAAQFVDVGREELVIKLMTDDLFALVLANNYLIGHINNRGLQAGVARYNGSGQAAQAYATKVLAKAEALATCFAPEWS